MLACKGIFTTPSIGIRSLKGCKRVGNSAYVNYNIAKNICQTKKALQNYPFAKPFYLVRIK